MLWTITVILLVLWGAGASARLRACRSAVLLGARDVPRRLPSEDHPRLRRVRADEPEVARSVPRLQGLEHDARGGGARRAEGRRSPRLGGARDGAADPAP